MKTKKKFYPKYSHSEQIKNKKNREQNRSKRHERMTGFVLYDVRRQRGPNVTSPCILIFGS